MRTQIEKIKKKTVVEHVMEQIKELIASGQYQVGQRLPTEQELAERFGIARSSVREAVKIFNYLGVLESQTGRGTYVCDRGMISTEALTWSILLGQEEFYELVALRELLERAGLEALIRAQQGAEGAASQALASLEAEIENMRAATTRRDTETRILADYNFHGTIIAASGNNLFVAIYRTLRSFMYDEIRKTVQVEDTEESIREHEVLLQAVREGNAPQAQALLREHIRSIMSHLKSAGPGSLAIDTTKL
jgi:GntR family transcriptional repressor for pyruvate dehydrogenase complex